MNRRYQTPTLRQPVSKPVKSETIRSISDTPVSVRAVSVEWTVVDTKVWGLTLPDTVVEQ